MCREVLEQYIDIYRSNYKQTKHFIIIQAMQVVQFIDTYNDQKSHTNFIIFFEKTGFIILTTLLSLYGFYYHTRRKYYTLISHTALTSYHAKRAGSFCYLSRTAWVVSVTACAWGTCWQLLQVQVFGELYDRMFAGGGGLAAGPLLAFETPRRRQHHQQHQHCHHQWQNEPAHRGHLRENRPLARAPIPCYYTQSPIQAWITED